MYPHLVVKDAHQGHGELFLHFDTDVRLQHLAKVLVLVLEEVEQIFVVTEGQDVDTLVLASQPQAGCFPAGGLFHLVPLVLDVPRLDRTHGDLDSAHRLLGLVPAARAFVLIDQQVHFVGRRQVFELELLAPEAASEVAQLFRGRPGVQLVVNQDFDVILLLLVGQAFRLQDVQPKSVFHSPPVLVPHQGLLEALHPLVPFPGALAGEVPGGAAGGVGYLKPGVLPDNGRMNRLDRDLVGVKVQPFDEALKDEKKLKLFGARKKSFCCNFVYLKSFKFRGFN